MTMRKLFAVILASAMCMALLISPISAKNGELTMDFIDVKSTGAKGDGKTDDTKAILDAVALAKKNGKAVFLPFGTYCISSSITLQDVDLVGNINGPFPADNDVLPTVQVTMTSSPAFVLKGNCTLSGFRVRNLHSGNVDQTFFKETVSIAGNNCTVRNMKFADVATGVVVNGTSVRGLELENIFMVNPFVTGVHLRNTVGKTIVKNVEMWVPSQAQGSSFSQSGIGILVENNEDLEMTACFSFNAYTGILFTDEEGKGGSKAVLNNCSVDLASKALVVEGTHQITVNGGTLWTHFNAVEIKHGDSTVELNAVEARSNGGTTVMLDGGKSFVMKNSIVKRVMDGQNHSPLRIQSGCAEAAIDNCIFYAKNTSAETVVFNPESKIRFSNCIVNAAEESLCLAGVTSNVKLSNVVTGLYVG